MQNKSQTNKFKENVEKNQLKFDYSELDLFLDKDCDPISLAKEFRDLHVAFTDLLMLVVNEEMANHCNFGVRDVNPYYLERFFQILDHLQFNDERE